MLGVSVVRLRVRFVGVNTVSGRLGTRWRTPPGTSSSVYSPLASVTAVCGGVWFVSLMVTPATPGPVALFSVTLPAMVKACSAVKFRPATLTRATEVSTYRGVMANPDRSGVTRNLVFSSMPWIVKLPSAPVRAVSSFCRLVGSVCRSEAVTCTPARPPEVTASRTWPEMVNGPSRVWKE